MKYFIRRLEKMYWKIVRYIFYKDWPIDLAYTDIADIYEPVRGRITLAEFDLDGRHYAVLKK